MIIKNHCIILFGLITILTGCKKEDFLWDLEKNYKLASIVTDSIYNITNTGVNVNSIVEYDGASTVTQRGVCWSTNQNPTIADGTSTSGSGIGSFITSISGLSPNTTYYVRAYAINGVGLAYGNQVSFTTSNISGSLPTLTTTSVYNITNSDAVGGGNIVSDGGSTVTQRGICWSTNQNPTIADGTSTSGSGIGSFITSISGLSPNTTYYVRAYAINTIGTSYGNQVSFTTSMPNATFQSSINCGTLNGFTTLYYGINGTSASWGLSNNGFNGACLVAPDPNNSGQLGSVVGSDHYIQFNHNFINQGFIEFWINTYNPGYENLIPVISVNNIVIGNAVMIGGQSSSFYWMKVRSPIVQAGNNEVKIMLSGSYYVLKIDEIDFYEY